MVKNNERIKIDFLKNMDRVNKYTEQIYNECIMKSGLRRIQRIMNSDGSVEIVLDKG